MLAGVVALAGCVTTDYGYRGGVSASAGDYYYGAPAYDDGWYGGVGYGYGYGYGAGYGNGWYDTGFGWGWPYAGYGYGPGWWSSGWGWGWPGYYYAPPVVIVRPRPPSPPPNNHNPPPPGQWAGGSPVYGNHGELLPPGNLPRPVQGAPVDTNNAHVQRLQQQLEQRNMRGESPNRLAEDQSLPRWNHIQRTAPERTLMPMPERPQREVRVERMPQMPPMEPRREPSRLPRIESRMESMPRMEGAPPAPRFRERNHDGGR